MIRSLLRSPLFTLTAVVSLALGIGANTAMFSMIDRVLLRSLPVRNPEDLVFLYQPGPTQGSISSDEPGGSSFSYPMFREMQAQQSPFTGLAGSRSSAASLSFNNSALPGRAHLVSGNYFQLLGVDAALGRVFNEDDDRVPGGHPVVVLSYGYWVSRFGSNAGVLNQTMVVNGLPMTIVGVARRGFFGETLGRAPDAFVPICMKREMTPDFGDGLKDRKNYWVTLFGRLKPGVSRDQAEAAINVTYRAQLEQDAALLSGAGQDFLQRFRAKKVILKPGTFGRGQLREQGRTPLLLLMAMTVLVLLISCANVANLQLARSAARTREVAVRLAMGASRPQLVRQLLFESCLVAISGALAGLAVAHWTLSGVQRLLPPETLGTAVLTSELDLRMLVFTLALALLTGVLFGLYPALQASKAQLTAALREQSGQTTATRATGFFRKALVTMQTALSLLLLVSAGLFAKTLVNLSHVDLGIRTDHLMTFTLTPKLNGYSDERALQFYQQLGERLSGIPGVTLVSAARVPAIAGSTSSGNLTIEGFTPKADGDDDSHVNSVGPGYFRTLGIPLVAGREFTDADNRTAPRVAIVNEAFVRHFLAGRNAIGTRMARGAGNDIKLDITIVGIVKDAKYSDMREAPPRVYYTPYLQAPRQTEMTFYVRTALDPEQFAPSIRREVATLDPNLPIREIKSMQAQIDSNMASERLLSLLTGSFAALATLLAAIGLYGVLAFSVARRTREIGIRMALGANARHVRRLVARDVLIMLAIGVFAGLGSATLAGRVVRSVLFGVEPWDPAVYGSAAMILVVIALVAAYLPARRATRVDPMIALRYE